MGMFDQVECQHPLPVLGVVEGAVWQSKDLMCEMATVTITTDGRLSYVGGVFSNSAPTDLEFHGDFHFYSDRDGEWFDFVARFTEGQLVRMWRIVDGERVGLTSVSANSAATRPMSPAQENKTSTSPLPLPPEVT